MHRGPWYLACFQFQESAQLSRKHASLQSVGCELRPGTIKKRLKPKLTNNNKKINKNMFVQFGGEKVSKKKGQQMPTCTYFD